MNMDENKNHINNRLSEQLPSHSPDPGTWQQLSAKLDAMDAEAAYQERLQELPVYTPDRGTWSIISSRLNRIAYYKTGIRIALSAAAGLILFFTVSRISDNYQAGTNKVIPQLVKQEQPTSPLAATIQPNRVTRQLPDSQQTSKKTTINHSGINVISYVERKQESIISDAVSEIVPSVTSVDANTALNQESNTIEAESEIAALNNEIPVNNEVLVQPDINMSQFTQNSSINEGTLPVKEITQTEIEPKSILFQKEQYTTSASTNIKQYSPPEPMASSNKNHVALGMNYLPENIYNGTDNSLFHNVDLTASYNKEKVRFNTGVGMAYNEEQLSFNMSYNINTPLTAMGPGGKVDTLSYEVANMDSEYLGTEKHKYVTYHLGIGRRIFSSGKFSTWFNAAAGFGVQLNNPDLITSTKNSIKNQYNAQIVSIESSKPVYNDVNINFVTAIDFNYMILNKLSITFTPTSRWYFKPVLSMNNQATDELTLGFRTGLKFDF